MFCCFVLFVLFCAFVFVYFFVVFNVFYALCMVFCVLAAVFFAFGGVGVSVEGAALRASVFSHQHAYASYDLRGLGRQIQN